MPTNKYTDKDYYKKEEYLSKRRAYARSLREKIFVQYGGKCVCCGESNLAFLTLDHKNNDGAKHRKELFGRNKTGGYPFYLWVVRNNYPKTLQAMCANCNTAKRICGICPHQSPKPSGDSKPLKGSGTQ